MRKILRFLLGASLSIYLIFALSACGGGGETPVNWLSPMMSVKLQASELAVYDGFDLAVLNASNTTPSQLLESAAVTKATVSFAYKGEGEYKAVINARIDEIEVEEDGSMGHDITAFGVSKTTEVAVLFYGNDETWHNRAFGSNAASGGDTLFDERYYNQDDAQYSASRLALLLNKSTAENFSTIDFYVVGLTDGYFVVNFYLEVADIHGHFHGVNKLALTSVQITVGTPEFHGGDEYEHKH